MHTIVFFFVGFICLCSGQLYPDIVPEYYIRIYHDRDVRESLRQLVKIGISLESHKLNQSYVDVVAVEEQLVALSENNYRFERLRHYSERESFSNSGYTDYTNLTNYLIKMENTYPELAQRIILGSTLSGRLIQGIRITKNIGTYKSKSHMLGIRENEPEVKYLANIHGNEPAGREFCVYFIKLLLTQYNATPSTPISERITKLIDNTDIYIIPSLNPDGFEYVRRTNLAGYDLNRNFPDLRFPGREKPPNKGGSELETQAIMKFCNQHYFVLSGSLHGGTVVANYPYDGNSGYKDGLADLTVDDDVFQALSLVYSNAHPTMHLSNEFHNGITNGAAWYVLYGGMQDWNYVGLGTMEITFEVSPEWHPYGDELPTLWNQNREAMLQFLEQVHTGVRGVVTDASTGQGLAAKILVAGRPSRFVRSDPTFGNYYRLLRPGSYTLTASADGYRSLSQTVNVPVGQTVYHTVQLNFQLPKLN